MGQYFQSHDGSEQGCFDKLEIFKFGRNQRFVADMVNPFVCDLSLISRQCFVNQLTRVSQSVRIQNSNSSAPASLVRLFLLCIRTSQHSNSFLRRKKMICPVSTRRGDSRCRSLRFESFKPYRCASGVPISSICSLLLSLHMCTWLTFHRPWRNSCFVISFFPSFFLFCLHVLSL